MTIFQTHRLGVGKSHMARKRMLFWNAHLNSFAANFHAGVIGLIGELKTLKKS